MCRKWREGPLSCSPSAAAPLPLTMDIQRTTTFRSAITDINSTKMIIICGLHRFSGSQCNSIRFIASRAGALQGRVGDQPKPPPCYFGMRARNNYGSSSSSSPPTPLCQIAHHRYYPSIHFSTFTKSEYIHPLSQIVLEHLQSHHSQWVTRMGLDTGLKLNKDGTFALRFPPSPGGAIETVTVEAVEGSSSGVISGSIW